jgi:hypothetical protein
MPGTERLKYFACAGIIPFVPVIESGRFDRGDLGVFGTFNHHLPARCYTDGISAGLPDCCLSGSVGNEGRAVLVNIHTVIPFVLDNENGMGCIHLHCSSGINRAQVEGGNPGSQLELKKIRFLVLKA